MGLPPGRRAAVLVVMALVAVAVVVVIVQLATGGSDDDEPPIIETVEDLGAALGCDELDAFEGALPLPKTEDASCTFDGRDRAAGLHLADDAGARAAVVQYFAQPPPGGTGPDCPDDEPAVAAARLRYAIVAGDRWVVTTRYPDVRDAALAAGGEEVVASPLDVPPASYEIGGPSCGDEPLLSSG